MIGEDSLNLPKKSCLDMIEHNPPEEQLLNARCSVPFEANKLLIKGVLLQY